MRETRHSAKNILAQTFINFFLNCPNIANITVAISPQKLIPIAAAIIAPKLSKTLPCYPPFLNNSFNSLYLIIRGVINIYCSKILKGPNHNDLVPITFKNQSINYALTSSSPIAAKRSLTCSSVKPCSLTYRFRGCTRHS